MTSKPVLHPLVEQKLTAIAGNPPHALLLAGPEGIGKMTIAHWLAAQVLQVTPEALQTYPHILTIAPAAEGKAIGIDDIRQLEHFVALRIPSEQQVNRMVILQDAHLLTTEAQNALLKTLEEPPRGTVLLLTAASRQALLPTILSRVQTLEVMPPKGPDLAAALSVPNAQQLLAYSGGLPGLAFALAANDQSHPLVQAAQTARALLGETAFQKVARVDGLSKDKVATANLLYILGQMAHAALLTGRNAERWQKVLTVVYQAQKALKQGTQPKLALTDLMLNL